MRADGICPYYVNATHLKEEGNGAANWFKSLNKVAGRILKKVLPLLIKAHMYLLYMCFDKGK